MNTTCKSTGSYFAKWFVTLCIVIMPNSTPIQTANAAPPVVCVTAMGMAIRILVPNAIYKAPVAVSIYLPPCYETLKSPVPVVYLLHGANADETQWPDLRIRLAADTVISQTHQPFMVVMPGGQYLNTLNYANFMLKDLLPAIEKTYHVHPARCGRAIGGLSMGGYWALKLALQHPDVFASVGGHSPVVSGMGIEEPLDLARTAKGLDRLRIALDVGKSDGLKSSTTQLADALELRSISVTLALNPGGHDRPYWRAHSEEYLRFYAMGFASQACR